MLRLRSDPLTPNPKVAEVEGNYAPNGGPTLAVMVHPRGPLQAFVKLKRAATEAAYVPSCKECGGLLPVVVPSSVTWIICSDCAADKWGWDLVV